MVSKHGEWYYNFWKDRQNPKGLWRRTSWDSYCSDAPEWDVLLDVDALAAADGVEWVFHGANLLRPEPGQPYRRALVALSPDGGDANRYREFDVETRAFVDPAAGGFDLPTAKGNVSWLDADTLLVASTAADLPRTASSYARTAVRLRRGQALSDAPRIFEIPEDHMMAIVAHDSTPGFERTFAVDWIDFFNRRTSVLQDGDWVQVDVPTDVNTGVHREWLLFRPQRDWTVNGTTYAAGSLLAADFRRLPGRGARADGPLRPGRAHVPAVLELDPELPAAEPAEGRVLGNPCAGSCRLVAVLAAGRLPAAARRQCLRRGRRGRGGRRCRGRLLARRHRLHDAQHPDPRHPDPRGTHEGRRRRRDFRRVFQRNVSGRRGEQPCGSEGVAVVLQ